MRSRGRKRRRQKQEAVKPVSMGSGLQRCLLSHRAFGPVQRLSDLRDRRSRLRMHLKPTQVLFGQWLQCTPDVAIRLSGWGSYGRVYVPGYMVDGHVNGDFQRAT